MISGLGMVFEAMWMELGRSGGQSGTPQWPELSAQEGPERSKTAQGHPRALEGTPRDDQKTSPRASGSALEALWTRLERRWGVQGEHTEPEMDAK